MKARQAQLRMYQLEMHEQEWSVIDYLQWLLSLEDDSEEAVQNVLNEEVDRAMVLCENHYARVSNMATVMNPRAILAIGFQQGATFAAAALGKEPHEH